MSKPRPLRHCPPHDDGRPRPRARAGGRWSRRMGAVPGDELGRGVARPGAPRPERRSRFAVECAQTTGEPQAAAWHSGGGPPGHAQEADLGCSRPCAPSDLISCRRCGGHSAPSPGRSSWSGSMHRHLGQPASLDWRLAAYTLLACWKLMDARKHQELLPQDTAVSHPAGAPVLGTTR